LLSVSCQVSAKELSSEAECGAPLRQTQSKDLHLGIRDSAAYALFATFDHKPSILSGCAAIAAGIANQAGVFPKPKLQI
jgi:hypothetical protein